MKTLSVIVTADVPRNVSTNDFSEYVSEAVKRWAKGLHVEDPLHDIDNVRVTKEKSAGR